MLKRQRSSPEAEANTRVCAEQLLGDPLGQAALTLACDFACLARTEISHAISPDVLTALPPDDAGTLGLVAFGELLVSLDKSLVAAPQDPMTTRILALSSRRHGQIGQEISDRFPPENTEEEAHLADLISRLRHHLQYSDN